MKKIILDTNFLLIPYQFKVDIFSEIERIMPSGYQLCIIDKAIDELKKLADGASKHSLAARLALVFVNTHNIKIMKTKQDKDVDSLIVDNADKDTIVATQDMELKKRLKEKGVILIVMRKKQYLELV